MSIQQVPSVASVAAVGCWVDLFEQANFRGKMRRLFGPSAYLRLRSSPGNWGIPIRSVIAGPGAFVQFYTHGHAEPGLWLEPGSRVDDLHAVAGTDAADSLKLIDHGPDPASGH
jgi:hypothetical protein